MPRPASRALGVGMAAAALSAAGLAFVPAGRGARSLAASSRPPASVGGLEALRGGLAARQVRPSQPGASGPGLAGQAGPAALSLACCAAAIACVRGLVESRTAMRFRKRYGGGPVKKDPSAEFGPQYWGPPVDYGIQRKARLGFPKGGEQRVIPKLSGGSYDARKNMMKNLTTELIRHGRIKTTYARATALRSFADRMIVLAKRGDDLARREASEWMLDDTLVENLFKLAPERYGDQRKDFTQVTRTMNRKGDWAYMAYIELL
mmetsp:Transcript_114831/g.335850  ORF Transcript_114831/g.335850 Transcript_114831/m.335850 type:complete len:263 (-) Transcript_114831:89-877(-)